MRDDYTPHDSLPDGGHEIDVLSRLFQVLSNPSRRHILTTLADESDPVSVPDIATDIGAAIDQPPNEVRTAIWHVHLPQMERGGLVQFNRADKTAELTEFGKTAVEIEQFAGDRLDADQTD